MKVFCEHCRDMVEYSTSTQQFTKQVKGQMLTYEGQTAECNDCHQEIFVSEIRDYNLKSLDSAYRLQEGLITVDEIIMILKQYDIGKRPLSSLLGWGEGTLTRYVDGDIPTKPYSELLKRISKDPAYYLEILRQNKERISPLAFTKSEAAAISFSNTDVATTDKLETAVKYLLVKTSDITPLALQKLLYYAQGFESAFCGTFLFNEDCEAWVHGPVFRNIYEKYKTYGYNPIEDAHISLSDSSLTDEERDLIDHIALYFGCYSGKILEAMTHSEEPWRVTRRGLNDWESSNRIIDKNEISSYFNRVKEKYMMLNYTDIKDYAKDLFDKVN